MSIEVFAKFSDSARRVLLGAQKIAQENNLGINSEHLLLSLASTPDTYAYKLLHQYTINVDQIKLILQLRGPESNLRLGLSSYVKKILELAAAHAANFGNTRVDAEHLLLAITSLEECLAYQVITRIGINPAQIKSNLVNLFTEMSNMDDLIAKHLSEPSPGRVITGDLLEPTIKKSKMPALDYFGANLTDLAKQQKLDPVIGRDQEIDRVIQILARKTKNNPILVGEPGVGKTAIVEGLARKIAHSSISDFLYKKELITLDLTLVVAGTIYRGQFEDRMKKILQEAKSSPNLILFIDEIHMLVGSGGAEGAQDASNILKPALAKGEIRLIGATTAEEYRKYIERDGALERRLQVVSVNEPTIDQTIEIVQGLADSYQQYHQVVITNAAIEASVRLADRYIHDRRLPDKAIDLLDEASARTRLNQLVNHKSPDMVTLEQYLSMAIHEKDQAIAQNRTELANHYQTRQQAILDELERLKNQALADQPRPTVDEDIIATIVSQSTGVPVTHLTNDEIKRFLNLEQELSQAVIGQEEVIRQVSSAIRRSKTRVSDPAKPLGSFIFLGPSGVGKTELARVLARQIFGSATALVKIDMSEFMERHSLSRLVGAPAGYVGYEDAGKLTEAIRRQPYSVVLFDEIEKAHPEILNILLQVLEDGYLSDARGRRVSFQQTIIILTSNIGLRELTTQANIGFRMKNYDQKKRFQKEYDEIKKNLLGKLKETLRPELLNRIDSVAVFKPLSEEVIQKITYLQIRQLTSRLLQEGYIIDCPTKTIAYIAARGFDPYLGARPIRKAVIQYLEEPLAIEILKGQLEKGLKYQAKLSTKGQLTIQLANQPSKQYVKISSPPRHS